MRSGALDTLALLNRDDQVAIFSFGEKPEMVEGLTSDHEALSVDLWALSPNGGTAIDDALYDAALYLGRNASNRRRAIILVSDNEPSDEQTRDVTQVVRAAQQSGAPIYSVRKLGYLQHSRSFFLTHPESAPSRRGEDLPANGRRIDRHPERHVRDLGNGDHPDLAQTGATPSAILPPIAA